jgi:hypothetical protein
VGRVEVQRRRCKCQGVLGIRGWFASPLSSAAIAAATAAPSAEEGKVMSMGSDQLLAGIDE